MNKKFDFIKAVYFVAFGIIFTVVVTLLFIIPHLKEYRDVTRQTQRQEKQIDELEKRQEGFKTNSEKLEKEYENGFSVLRGGFDKNSLLKHVPKGCELKVGEKTGEEREGKFLKETFDAIMVVSTPADYYKFIELATKEGTLCSVDQGMVMQSIEGGRLKIAFIVTSYSYAKEEKKEEKPHSHHEHEESPKESVHHKGESAH